MAPCEISMIQINEMAPENPGTRHQSRRVESVLGSRRATTRKNADRAEPDILPGHDRYRRCLANP